MPGSEPAYCEREEAERGRGRGRGIWKESKRRCVVRRGVGWVAVGASRRMVDIHQNCVGRRGARNKNVHKLLPLVFQRVSARDFASQLVFQ